MELVLELFLTLFVAVLFSFLIAKLISFASVSDDDQQASIKDLDDGTQFLAREFMFEEKDGRDTGNSDPHVRQGVDEEIHQFENIESVNKFESSVSRDELVQDQEQQQLRDSAATIDDALDKSIEMEFICHEFPAETAAQDNVDRKDFIEFDETTKENLTSMVSTQFDESGAFGELLKVINSLSEEDQILENVEANDQIGKEEVVDDIRDDEEATEVKSGQNYGSETLEKEMNRGDERTQEWSDGNEDDWEGVEQSKLQKVFDQASKFVVCSMGEDIWGNDLHMQLYGLHKVALEGPCQEPQPMALKLSARSKWNAWQRLGNMSPDVAMEHYINLLSDKYPQWMEENPSGDITIKTLEAGGPGDQDYIEDKPYEGKEMEVKFTTG